MVILADDKIAKGELVYLGQLMRILQFDSAFVEEARKFNMQQAYAILEGLSEAKKHSLGIILHEMAYADGDIAREEIHMLFSLFEKAGIEIEEPHSHIPVFDIADVYFKSALHKTHDKEANNIKTIKEKRAVKIEPHIQGRTGYTVTTYKVNGLLQFWGNKVLVGPVHMDVVSITSEKSFLKGFKDQTVQDRFQHSNYSLEVNHPDQKIENIILYKHHKNVAIEFLR